MTAPHDQLRESLGAYVLDQLDADERREVEDHLETCADCRGEVAEIAPLAAALRGVDADAFRFAGTASPPALDERIRQAIPAASMSRRRWAPAAGAAALAAAAAVAVAVTAVVARDDAPTVIAVPALTVAEGITATAGLVDHTWGVEIKLEATGLRAGERFEVWVVDDDGASYDAGEILGVAGTTIICDMSSSVLLENAASFRVVDAGGAEVIAAAMPSTD